jgi:hypothetical protein
MCPLVALGVPAATTDIALLHSRERAARKKVRALRGTGWDSAIDMNMDLEAVRSIRKLQDISKKLLLQKYKKHTFAGGREGAYGTVFHVLCEVTFPETMPDYAVNDHQSSFVIETAPLELLPHSVLNFVELATSNPEKDGIPPHFEMNREHILQIAVDNSAHRGLAFQEYSGAYPHHLHTLGFAGRPGGASPYISTMDNSVNHGPGSQGSRMGEADTCFARILSGHQTVNRLHNIWGKREHGFSADEHGFIFPENEHAKVTFSLCHRQGC